MAGTDDLRNMVMTFRVSELQMLLGFAGRNKSGRKNELQTRALDLLRLKSAPIQMKIRELYKSIQQGVAQGQLQGPEGVQPPSNPPNAQATAALHQQMVQKNSMLNCPPTAAPAAYPTYQSQQQGRGQIYPGYYQPKTHTPPLVDPLGAAVRSTMPNNLPVHPDVQLKRLPFYDLMSELLKPSTLMPTGTARIQEQAFVFHLTPQQANDIAFHRDISAGARTDFIIQVQMRFCLLETSCEQEDFFPPNITVKVNGKVCPLPNPIPTNRPGVEAKRPPRPVNISSLLRLSPTVANHVQVSWGAEYGRGYVIAINLVKKLTSQQLLQRLRTRGVRHADYTTGLIKEKLREDADSEIATTSLRVSLMCPLGKLRMTIPCRPTTCTHLQCFDANLYLQMNERKPTWTCPVCDKPGLFDKLVIDGYFQEVLSSGKLPPDGNEIQLHQDGTWSISASKKDEKADDAPAPVKNRGGPPAVTATVEIADDEVVPVVSDGEDKDKDKEKTSEAKAAAPKDVVDLTFSDDSDEEMAPATAKTNGPAKTEVTSSSAPTPATPGYMSPNIITLDSPSPPSTPPPTAQQPPAQNFSSSTIPPFFDLDNDSPSTDYHAF
ncbi:E3 SUMO-protein ligase PIAS2 isoform X2 [Homalodisca vitripennis]|uniref:E3 SUMO-protein ligase PIAS2 isoform X2 n=1 Tax=Homalodisca vitripennis TaxID=197043 RepID=UPI001EEB0AED|nr:E3 SUMO-protein ligase PIAS2 isoform X2 [Homalodisca vitripennis]